MARAASKPKAEPVITSTALTNWEAEMEAAAQVAVKAEQNTGGGQFFSMRGGILAFNGTPVPNNTLIGVVIDFIFENLYYAEDFDADTPVPPTCFAFGEEEDDMAPHESVVAAGQAQNATCAGCPQNAWASAPKGRGKACRNTRRLAIIPAGALDGQGRVKLETEPAHFAGAAVGYMKLPVTSVKLWGAYVKQIGAMLRRPPHGVFTKITVTPDPRTQFRVGFEPVDKVPAELLATMMKRHAESKATIQFPYNLERDEAPKPAAQPAKKRKF